MNRVRGVFATLSISAVVIVSTDNTASGQQQPPADPPMPGVLKNYRSVTAERLKNPNDEDWLMIRRTYDGWGFSPLTDITPANVQRLRPAWVFSTAEPRVHQVAPLVNGGVMFVTSPNNQVIAIDVKSGDTAGLRPGIPNSDRYVADLCSGGYSATLAARWQGAVLSRP